jgi:prepilin-type N-terminal cleavage/methylation domain-containing protein
MQYKIKKIIWAKKLKAIRYTLQDDGGFTLAEMFVVISIFAIMASIVIFKFQSYNKSATLDNLAQDVALRVVQAQKTAISGVLTTGVSIGVTAPIYGVYFSSNPTSSANKKFIYFTDIYPTAIGITPAGNAQYDTIPAGTSTSLCGSSYGAECLSVTSMTTGDYISTICTQTGLSSANCPSPGVAHISFQRPFPDAHIRVCPGTYCTADSQKTYIELTSGSDVTLKKTIIMTNLGQIRVFNGKVHDACIADGLTSGGC